MGRAAQSFAAMGLVRLDYVLSVSVNTKMKIEYDFDKNIRGAVTRLYTLSFLRIDKSKDFMNDHV